jgi:transposase InsO family protein
MLVQIGSASTDRPTRSCCDDQLNPPNIPRSSSAAAAAMQAYAPRWARSATRMNNAMCESSFATLECELLDRCRFKTQTEARRVAFEFIEGFYNPRRRHSSIGYLSPIDCERQHYAAAVTPGTEKWLCQGPNQRMSRNGRAICHQIR